jgi:hypothetical protein
MQIGDLLASLGLSLRLLPSATLARVQENYYYWSKSQILAGSSSSLISLDGCIATRDH